MSNKDQIKNPELIQITAPTIGDAGYADNLNKTFNNIDANFATLSNYDFIKGESGTSVTIRETPFYINDPDNAEKKKLSYYGQLLKDYITSLETNDDQSDIVLADGTVLNIFDNFTEDTAGSIYMVYNTENDFTTASTPVSSLYYVFLDGRYAPKNAKIAEETAYDTLGLKDFSCIVVYDGSLTDENGYVTGGFKSLQNAFPTIYFEQGVGLCWKINGSHTGLPVKGIPGKDGSNATLYIVQSDSIIESEQIGISTECEISGIYESYDGYVPITDYGDVSHLNNQSALILTKDPNSDKNLFYFGKLGLKEEEIIDGEETKIVKTLYGYCTPSTSINVAIDNEAFINSMKSINILSKGETADSGVKGLFIPLNHNSEGEQKVHLLSATSIANVEGKTNDLKTDVLFTAINDINSLAVDGEDKDKQLQIDKYMYVKINKEAFDFYASINDINYGAPAAEGYLKYKLKDIITDIDSPFLDTDTIGGARHYGFINDYDTNGASTGKKIQLNENNTRFVNSDGTVVADHWASMPESFRSRLRLIGDTNNVAGIYRWELESKSDAWDIDELKAVDTENYSFDSKFKTIFTTTVSPGTSVEFMWFNGMQLANNYDETQYDEDINGVSTRLYVIRGWEASNEFFNFIKFVPIYLNKFNIDEDTALNLNYNVNITGDTNDSKRSITVHGDVNCDNINVYRLTATGAIEHIYTPNDIVSDGGLTLGKITVDDDKDASGCVITADGIVNAQSANFKNDVNSDVANIDTIYNNTLNTLDINLDASSEAYVHINKYQPNILNSSSICIDADLMGVNNIDISPIKKTINTVNDVPAMTTSMPSSYTNNANIVVSNQSTNSKELYITNTPKDVKISDALIFESGSGVDTKNTSFDSAKNFNMHRLSLNAETSYGSSQADIAKDSVSLPTNIDKKFVVYSERGYDYTRFDAENSDNINISASNYIQKISIKKPDNSIVNTTANLKIIFKDEFICHIGLRGRNKGGSWPVLNSDSQLQLKVYYAIGNSNAIKELYTDTKIYKFNYSTNSILYDTSCKWKGWNENGVWLGDNDNDNWRYCAFSFRPYNISIPSSVCDEIFTELNNNSTVYIYVVPYFKLAAHVLRNWWADRRNSLAGICATCPRVLKTNTSRSASTTITKIDTNLPLTEARSEENNGYVIYYINKLIGLDNGVSSTTICDDGIVMRSGQYVFGLGYTQDAVDHRVNEYDRMDNDPSWKVSDKAENNYISKPILFYHKYDNRYYNGKEPYTNDKSNKGYAKRMDAIPLEDIFEAIRHIRESTANSYGL